MKRIALLLILVSSFRSIAQHNHTVHSDTMKMKEGVDMKMDSTDMPTMSHAFSLNLPMSRNGSGTGWLPDSTPMYGYMIHGKKWMYMIHGNIFLRYTNQDIFDAGSRGADKFDAVNWFMAMGQRKIGRKGLFRFSSMISLDNIFGGNGYPFLFQTGESWEGKPLVDRQHPHDLFSELSISYSHSLNKNADVFIYAGYPGEPALGSVAFMHRISSLYGPDAPLSHHWNDGTHITFGVLTGGVRLGKFKIDVSTFKGREPDENRNDLDMPKLDSYSGRISFNPNAYWSFQVSEGYIISPESTHPSENVYRSTVSAVYSKPLKKNNFLNMTVLWGMNKTDGIEQAALAEAALIIKRLSIYSRYEWVQKSVDELDLEDNGFKHGDLFPINAVTLGLGFDIIQSKAGRVAIGAQGSFYSADSRLNCLYGKNPMSGEVFIRLYPPRMKMMKM